MRCPVGKGRWALLFRSDRRSERFSGLAKVAAETQVRGQDLTERTRLRTEDIPVLRSGRRRSQWPRPWPLRVSGQSACTTRPTWV